MTSEHRILIDADGLRCLGLAIAHWARLATGARASGECVGIADCALCDRWLDADNLGNECEGCPVQQTKQQSLCRGTPYPAVVRKISDFGFDSLDFRRAARLELNFLVRLLAKAELIDKEEE